MTKNYKFIIWCVLVAVTSFWMWASIHTWFQGSLFEVQNKTNLAISSGLFIVLLSLLAMGLILFRNRLWSVYLGLIVGITFSLVFGVSNINLVGIFILVMLFFQAQDIVSGEINERIKMNSKLLVKKGLSSFIVAFFILASFAAYQNPAIEEFKNIEKLPSSSEIFIKTIAEQTLGGQLDQASPQQKELVLNQVAREATNQMNTFLQPYFQYAPPALAFGLFLVLWGVGWIFTWLAVFLGMLLFQILKKVKFFNIIERDVKAETIIV
ncbi:MAG: hypothetical protein HYT62_03965 [Candidatus Yanofskybacteria bacterium]|nr:hypothetical protein [Candidatus Yanofskybacteria bacterium]